MTLSVLLIGAFSAHAQVGIGTLTPQKSAQLEVFSSNKGILIPQVALTHDKDQLTISNGNVESLLVFNTSQNQTLSKGYYYWLNNQWNRLVTTADVQGMIENLKDTNTTNISLEIVNERLVLTDSDGNALSVALADLQTPETVTTLTNNNNGTFTYVSEDQTTTLIDIPGEVITHFQQIAGDTSVILLLEQIIKNTPGNVLYDGTQFTYVDANGDTQIINIQDMVQNFQSTVTLVDGTNTTVESAVDPTNANHTNWKVNVATANAGQLGVVKEAATNPSVRINAEGELAVDYAAFNAVKEVATDYTVASTDAILLGDAANNNITLTLPEAAANKGKKITIKKQDSNESTYVNVEGNITGVTNGLYTSLPYSGWELVSDGTAWKIVVKF